MVATYAKCAHCGLPHESDVSTCPFTGKPFVREVGEDLVGSIVEHRYRIEAFIGAGGMGAVFRACDVRIEKMIAIKVMSVPGQNERFLREARAAARVRHENVVKVYDVGALPDGTPFIAMELLSGESLAERLARERTLPIPAAVNVAQQALHGLAAVHATGAIHRDVKPGNLFLARERVKLLDFGLSRSDHEQRLTRTGEVIGTPCYLAPEQARGISGLDHRIDLWACGVVLYEMLAGQGPFDGISVPQIIARILTQDPPPPSSLRLDVPPALDAVILKALEKDRDRRFTSAAAMSDALALALAGADDLDEGATERMEPPVGAFDEREE